MEEKKVKYTNGIPICPNCNKPTIRTKGARTSTLIYFPPRYDENGVNLNPDRNTVTSEWRCEGCNKDYLIRGNDVDGFSYL